MATQEEVDALTDAINEKRARYQNGQDTLTARASHALVVEIEHAQREREAAIRGDAGPCLRCGGEPTGLIQHIDVQQKAYVGYGIRCSAKGCPVQARHVSLDVCRIIWAKSPERMDAPMVEGVTIVKS